MDTRAGDLAQLIMRAKRLAHRISAEAATLHANSGTTEGARALLEHLTLHEPLSVARIARDKGVSRQNIQIMVNELLAQGWAESIPNPAHKKSPLLQRTPAGKALFQRLRKRESEVIKAMTQALPSQGDSQDLKTASKSLQRLLDYFASDNWLQVRQALRQDSTKLPD